MGVVFRGQPTANVHKCALRAIFALCFQIPGYAPRMYYQEYATHAGDKIRQWAFACHYNVYFV